MILIDGRVGSKELLPHIHRYGVPTAQLAELQYGDACFDGNGPNGKITIGVERKTLSDFLNCIDDARYSAYQKPGMNAMYEKQILIVEGIWKPNFDNGYLMTLVGAMTWTPFKYRMQWVRYSKLFRYLLTIQMTGTIVIQTRDIQETAFNIVEMMHYFSKRWEDHTAMLETQKLNLPDLRIKPSLVRRWASEIDGIGVKYSMEAENLFKTPIALAQGDEMDWVKIGGIGVRLARKIVANIRGW